MTPQTASFLVAADRALSIDIPDQAARLAYYAHFHAAQGFIFERTSKITKTHKGVATQFHKLAKAEPAFSPDLAAELSAACRYKERADYETGTAPPITSAQASDAIVTAENFVAVIRRALAPLPAP